MKTTFIFLLLSLFLSGMFAENPDFFFEEERTSSFPSGFRFTVRYTPSYISVNAMATFYITDVRGILPGLEVQTGYQWFFKTIYGWEQLSITYGTESFTTWLGGYSFTPESVEFKCVGENYITGQSFEYYGYIQCPDCDIYALGGRNF